VHALSQLDSPVTTLRKMGRSIHPNVPAFTPDDSFTQGAQIPETPPERQKTVKPASKADRKPRPKANKQAEQ
jgi:NTE family protein